MTRFINTGSLPNEFINANMIKRVRGAFAEYNIHNVPTGLYSVRCYYNTKSIIDESRPNLVDFEDFIFDSEHLALCFIERITKCNIDDLNPWDME